MTFEFIPADFEPREERYTFFYQLCTFANPSNQKYDMRKFVLNNNNEFVSVENFQLTKKQCKKFFQVKKQNEYKCYPVYNLHNIEYPNASDILTCQSSILSNESDVNNSNFAAFNM